MKVDKKQAGRVALRVASAVLVPIAMRKAAKVPVVRDLAAAIAREVLR